MKKLTEYIKMFLIIGILLQFIVHFLFCLINPGINAALWSVDARGGYIVLSITLWTFVAFIPLYFLKKETGLQ